MLDLPVGFSYKVISRAGATMDDGLLLPGLPDAMATFPGPQGRTIVIRNHELTPDGADGPFGEGLLVSGVEIADEHHRDVTEDL